MKKVNTFLHIWKHSLYPIDAYYQKVRSSRTSMAFSLKYFITLMIVLNLIFVTSIAYKYVSRYSPQEIRETFVEPLTRFPDDLIVSVDRSGRMTSTFDRPYVMYTDKQNGDNSILVVVDPQAKPDDIKNYEARLLLSGTSYTLLRDGQYYTTNYPAGKRFYIDKETAGLIAERLDGFIESYPISVALIVSLALILITFAGILGKMILLILASLIAYLVMRMFTTKHTLYKTYQIGLHALTGPLMIEYLLHVTGLPAPLGAFGGTWFLILTTIFLLGALYEGYIVPKEA